MLLAVNWVSLSVKTLPEADLATTTGGEDGASDKVLSCKVYSLCGLLAGRTNCLEGSENCGAGRSAFLKCGLGGFWPVVAGIFSPPSFSPSPSSSSRIAGRARRETYLIHRSRHD